ncbi:MAG: class I SAM-dependent methyltransferase [Candidatus Omnitrophica bacterium]|nr:class I SAM-dependent methyltransferase [Candidatus Omnitrophota bacterium]
MDESTGDRDYTKVSFDFEALDACPFCKKNIMIPSGRIQWLGIDFWYVFCAHCGLKFMNPRPTEASYKEFYKTMFWEQKVRNIGFHQIGQMWQTGTYKWDNDKVWDPKQGLENRLEKHREQRVKTIIPVVAGEIFLNKDSRILEVGCGFGVTLSEFHKQYGCKVFGIEPSDEAQKTIRSFGTIEVLARYAEDLKEIGEKGLQFNAIIFSHALENTVDPVSVLQWAKACLVPGGVIYIQTPNLVVFDQMNPYHPYIFSHASLDFLAEKVGMTYKRTSLAKEKMLTIILKKDR